MEVIFEGKAYTLTNVYNPPTKDLTLDVDPGVISRMIIATHRLGTAVLADHKWSMKHIRAIGGWIELENRLKEGKQ